MTAPTNYANLITSIGEYIHRTDVAGVAPEWITDAETVMNYGDGDEIKGLRTAAQETITTLTCTPGTQTVALPSDYLDMRKLYMNFGGTRIELVQAPILPMSIDERSNILAPPWGFIVVGSNLYLLPIPNSNYTLVLDYYAKIGPLATSSTNWLLTMVPDIYRSGAILAGAAWLGPSFDPAPWFRRFKAAMGMVAAQDSDRRGGLTTLRTDVPNTRRSTSNILMGY